jgi:transcriptional regulator with GAF, ATPase, and Fis domain
MEDRFGDCAAVFEETKLVMIAPPVVASSTDIYDAVVALSRSIAGRSDLESLLSGVGESLRRVVGFDCVGLALHDPKGNRMQDHILRESGTPVASICLQVDQDPAGWVWLNQQPLVIASLAAETR